MNKRGSHVGMILSFTIFVIALLYLYEIMNPFSKVDKEKEELIEQIRISLENQLKTEVTNIAIYIKKPEIKEDCISIPYEKFQENDALEKNHIVKDFSGTILQSKINDKNIEMENTTKARIVFAEEIENDCSFSPTKCEKLDYSKDEFEFARSKNKIYSEKKIKELIESLEEEETYYKTREKFFLPANSDFNIVFNDSKKIIGKEINVANMNVFVREFPINYINSNAEINTGFLSIFVW